MIDHDNLEDFRDPQIYDLQDAGYEQDYPLTEHWARSLGGPLLTTNSPSTIRARSPLESHHGEEWRVLLWGLGGICSQKLILTFSVNYCTLVL